MAKMRYDRKMLEEQQKQEQLHDQYAHMDHEIESYMTTGYEELARREYEKSMQQQQPTRDVYSHFGSAVGGHIYNKATDPVYNIIPNSGPEWEQRQQQAMENQYGAFQQKGWGGVTMIQHDDDMEML